MTEFIEKHAVKLNHRDFADSVDELQYLVESDVSENKLQSHLEKYPYILSQQFAHCHHVFPKIALGVQYETDFMCLDIPSSGKEWIGVELESSKKQVITKTGRKRAELEHAIQQVRDWRSWITENLSYARKNKEQNGLGLTDIAPRFFGYVIIGRRHNYNSKFNELRRQLLRDELITVRSWDGIVELAKKRAKFYSGIPAAFSIIKQQQSLIELQEKKHRLETIISEYQHSKELLNEQNKSYDILDKQLTIMLMEIGSKLPDNLLEKISNLKKEGLTVPDIIIQVKSLIPEDIPENILEEYLTRYSLTS